MKLPEMYGVTHDETGALTARVPRATKVAIGKPKGKALHVYLSQMTDGGVGWVLEIGAGRAIKQRVYKLEDLNLLKKDYQAYRLGEDTPMRPAPEKLGYFTFFKEAKDGGQVHDFDAILRHGVKPKEVEIVLTDPQPFDAHYAFWSASELRCRGNGIDAKRSVNFTPTKEDMEAAAAAKANGARFFVIENGCWTRGCPYAKTVQKGGREYKQCGPTASLSMQLLNDIRLGAKAEYTTTGYRTISQLAGGLNELATFTGGGDPANGTVRGIPLVLTMGQFRTNHNGQPGTAFSVWIEFRATSIKAMQAKLTETAEAFGMIQTIKPAPAARQIAAPPPVEEEEESADDAVAEAEFVDDETMAAEADGFNAQFVDDGEEIVDGEPADQAGYDETRAKLMAEAEAAEPNTTVMSQAETSGITDADLPAALFPAGQAPQAAYVDPGEQQEPRGRRPRNPVNFGR